MHRIARTCVQMAKQIAMKIFTNNFYKGNFFSLSFTKRVYRFSGILGHGFHFYGSTHELLFAFSPLQSPSGVVKLNEGDQRSF